MKNEIIIKVENLSKSFGDLEAVKAINLEIPKGKVFGFLGPNGAGKTTSLSMITGLLTPDSGKITIDGKNPEKADENKEIKRMMGMIPQEVVIWEELSVEENLMFAAALYNIPRKVAKERVDQLLKEIQLEEKRKKAAKTLSGGMKRRLNLIMGIIHEPEIVVCDEPTPGLDPQSRAFAWEFIKDLARKKNKTVILTTHSMAEADELSDIIAIIDEGKILVVDTPENLKSSIGEGDLMEISLNNDELLEPALEKLKNFENNGLSDTYIVGNILNIKGLKMLSKLAGILNDLETIEGLEVVDMKIRKTTLEDVFLHLTGKALRE